MGTETELKLRLDPTALKRLRRHPLLSSLKRARSVTRFQKSVYFDTSDFRLRAQQLVLRVRHLGRRRVQTVKTVGEPLAGLWARGEWESEISGDQPELGPLLDAALPQLDADERLIRELRPVFATEVRRTVILLGEEGWEVELALDEGQIVASNGSAPISELELELKQGEPQRLFELALKLQENVAAQLVTASKAERGFALIDNTPAAPQKAQPVRFPAEVSSADAFRLIARSCLGQLLVNQLCLLDTHDPEAVHQMRVALRRLRSAMNVFKDMLDVPGTEDLRGELRWLQGPLGAARDADVFLAEILDPLAETLAGEAGYVALREAIEAHRREAYDQALTLLAEPRFTQLALRLGQWIEDGDWLHRSEDADRARLDRPASILAEATLAKRHRKVAKGMRHLAELPPELRHRVRIEVKKLRYAVDFFAPLYPDRKAKRLLPPLGALQDCLGLLNDIAVSRPLLRQYAADDAERLWAAGLIAGWHSGRIPTLLKDAASEWKAYRELPRFWR